MSAADILAVLYFDVMRMASPRDPGRDRFILSKGHCVSALYSALVQKGFLERERLEDYCRDGSMLMGHPTRGGVPGIEASTGSLGHGLPMAVGMAWAAAKDGLPWRTFVLLGDGECQEGSVWEGAMAASHLRLSNLVAVVDANNIQGYGRCEDILPTASLGPKFKAFGWGVREVDGHNCRELADVLGQAPFEPGRPSVMIAHTIKGKGVREMEDKLEWHYFSVPEAKLPGYLAELEGRTPCAPPS